MRPTRVTTIDRPLVLGLGNLFSTVAQTPAMSLSVVPLGCRGSCQNALSEWTIWFVALTARVWSRLMGIAGKEALQGIGPATSSTSVSMLSAICSSASSHSATRPSPGFEDSPPNGR